MTPIRYSIFSFILCFQSMLADTPQQLADLNNSAQDWRDSLKSAHEYAQATQILADHDMPDLDNMYQVLGLTPTATESDIKRAYRKESLVTHPDKWSNMPDSPEKQKAAQRFVEINRAYTALTNPELKKAYDLINEQSNRLDFEKADIPDILKALNQATLMVETIQKQIPLLKNKSLQQHEIDRLNELLKDQYNQLKLITKKQVILDGTPIEESIRKWAKSMVENMQHMINETTSPTHAATARTDQEYTDWLYQDRNNITMSAHDQGRTPLQEAVHAGSTEMANNVIAAALKHGIKFSTLIKPLKEEYATYLLQGQQKEAEGLLNNVYNIGNQQLSNEMYAAVDKLARISPVKKP